MLPETTEKGGRHGSGGGWRDDDRDPTFALAATASADVRPRGAGRGRGARGWPPALGRHGRRGARLGPDAATGGARRPPRAGPRRHRRELRPHAVVRSPDPLL